MIETNLSNLSWDPTKWDLHAKRCQRDLIIKKIALAAVALMNIGAVASLCAYLVLYPPFPESLFTTAALLTPVIMGVFAALSILKIPTFGVSSFNYKNVLNPLTTAAKVGSLLLFAPIIILSRNLDFTDYGDPFEAKCIKKGMTDFELEEAMSLFGPRINNLMRYGYLSEEHGKEFKAIYLESAPLFQTKKDLQAKETVKGALKGNLDLVERDLTIYTSKWSDLKAKILPFLPEPDAKNPDYTKKTTCIKSFLSKHINKKALHNLRLH